MTADNLKFSKTDPSDAKEIFSFWKRKEMVLKIIWLAGLHSEFLNYWRILENQQGEQ